ncbi:response regulator transcription factor [Candidatus Nephthysia bennettiae]|uniref:response regulator transcription factor n=1 Tax=Candidatus Nephthysia bennettiae TaxID=3127016 RepID=UPI0030C6F213
MNSADAVRVRILIVEDEARLANLLRLGLQEEGFGVDVVGDGEEAVAAALATAFDLITLDVMLPGQIDGFTVCAELRRHRVRTPVLMLTARDAIDDRVRGLESGADDYLVKPFAFVEFLARVRALVRRHLPDRSSVLHSGALSLDTSARELRVDDRPVRLTGKEFAILEYFMHHPRRVLARAQIEEHVWDYDFEGSSNLVDVYMGRLRRKLAEAGAADHIVTLRGMGYRFDPRPGCASNSGGPESA